MTNWLGQLRWQAAGKVPQGQPVRHEPVTADRPDDARAQKIAFPDRSEWVVKRNDFGPPGERARYERAFYLTSRHLRLNVVPRTLRAELDGEPVTVQRFVSSELPTPALDERFSSLDWENLVRLGVLHYVTRLHDGHGQNVVPFEQGRKTRGVAIDGELTFGASEQMGRPQPNSVFDSIAEGIEAGRSSQLPLAVKKNLAGVQLRFWKQDLAREGLSETEIDSAVQRLERLRNSGDLRLLLRR